jgi:hypothetical protein
MQQIVDVLRGAIREERWDIAAVAIRDLSDYAKDPPTNGVELALVWLDPLGGIVDVATLFDEEHTHGT